MKKVFRFGLVLISLLTLFSCNPFSVDENDECTIQMGGGGSATNTELQNTAETGSQNLQSQKAFIKVVFNDGSSRTVLPSLYLKNFVLTGKRNGGAEQELAKAATKADWSGKSIEILTGDWELTMSAEVADGSTVIDGVTHFKDTQAVSVGSGANVLSFVLKPFKSDGTEVSGGELSVTLSLDPEAKADKARAVLKASDGTEFTKDYPDSGKLSQGASITFQKSNLPAGTYNLEIEFYSENENGDKIKQNSWMAIVRIAAGLKSSATVQNFNLNEVYKITYNTNGGTLATGVHVLSYSRKSDPIELATCSKTGFLFMGWYETNNPALADVPAAAKTNFSPKTEARNKTFFALWTKNTVYVKAGGSGNGFSSENPVANFSDALTAIGKIKTKRNSAQDFTIKVCGEVNGNQEIPASFTTATATKLTIEGNTGNTTDSLNANGSGTVLTVGTAVPVTVKNLKITGGNAENGGGISVASGATLTVFGNAEITSNTAKDGGGINNAGTLYLGGGVISKNTATNCGGGVYNTGTMFMYGSAVIGDSSKETAAVNSESCYSNKATESGGGIYSTGNLYLGFSAADTEATLTGGVYYNYAKNSGGIYHIGTTSSKEFKLNSGSVLYNAERGMYVGKGKFTMTGGTVSGNTALQTNDENEHSWRGGGIYVGADCTAVIRGGKITSNEAAVKGGGIHIAQVSSKVTIEGGTISGNTAGSFGSGISMDNGSLKFQGGAKVDSNNDVYLPSGKTIIVSGELAEGSDTVAKISVEEWKRGTTVVTAGTGVTLTEAIRKRFALSDDDWETKLSASNSITIDAPIYVSKNGHYVTSGENKTTGTKSDPFDTIEHACSLLTDKDTDYTIYIDGEVTGAQIIPSTLKKDGTGTYKAKSVTISGATGNTTDCLKGGFNKDSNGTTLKILSDVPLTIKNLKITGGYASKDAVGGGGLYTKGDVTLSDGTIVSGNYSGSCGGGIYNDSKTLTIESDVEISSNSENGNETEGGGGGIFNSSGTVIIKGGTIKTNSANHYGGAIYNESGTVYIYGDTLIGNVVSAAPTDWYYGSSKADNGGAIYNKSGNIYIGYKSNNGTPSKDDSANVKIMGNAVKSSSSKGGAIYVEAGTLQIAKTCIGFNYSPYSGAGIYTKGSVRLLEDAIIKGNKAFSFGGGVYVDQGGQLSMTSNSIIGGSESCDANTAASGGGVYVSSNSTDETKKAIVTFGATGATVSPSISGNSATQAGGGVYIDNFGATFNMHSGTISNNKVVTGTTGGGGIEISYGTFNMECGTISGNKIETPGTSVLGGAVDVNVGGKFNIKGSVSIPYGGEKYNNDVNLRSNPITITGAITLSEGETFVAAIIPQSYATSTQVFEIVENPNPMTTLSRAKNKFSLIQKDGESWFINNQGYLQVGTLVQSATDLMNNFANINTMTSEQTADLYIVFDRDIDISSETDWMPIGYASKSAESAGTNLVEFNGTIDGNGHTLTISDNQSKRFSALCYTNNGVIQNIKIKSTKTIAFDTNAPHFIFSGICVNNNGIIKNCWNEIDCEGITFEGCGGICITNNGVIENCINTGSITSTFHTNGWGGIYQPAGGIVGTLTGNGVIKNCVNYGTVEVPKKFDDPSGLSGLAGAIAGYSSEDGNVIQNCYWRYNCVRSNATQSSEGKFNTSATDDLNWMICKSQNYDTTQIRKGTFTGNGSFAANNNGSLTAASANDAVTAQTLQYGTNLLSALNSFVSENSSDELCTWVAGNSYAAIPSCFEE